MSFRTSQRDDRRRRIMTAGADRPAGSAATPRRSPADDAGAFAAVDGYSDAALPEHQLRLVDLVPLKGWKVAVSLLAVAAVVATMMTLHTWLPDRVSIDLTGTALDVAASVGLATWLSSMMLLASSVMAMIVYSIRSHKVDDYRGRYRVWRQAAIAWLVLSIATGANACPTIEVLLSSLAGGTLAGNVALWWALPAAMLVGYFAPALLADLSRCRLGSASLVAAVGCWAFATASRLGRLPLDPAEQPRIVASAFLVGHCLLLTAMTLYARFVVRESQGLVVPRVRKTSRKASSESTRPQEPAKQKKVGTPKRRTTRPNETQDDTADESPTKQKKRFFSISRGKKARVEPAHEPEDEIHRPHVSTRELAQPEPKKKQQRLRDIRPSSSTTAAQAVATTTNVKTKRKQASSETHDDPIADEIARLEGLGGRLSKSQRKKLRKLRRQSGQSE